MHRGLGFFYPQNVVRKSEPNYKGINMKSLEESVVTAMDGTDSGLFPFLPYILQELWEIGASPEVIIRLVRKHTNNYSSLSMLDLGC
ncbi:MAG: hypothetical protein KKE35_05770 [Actinobacteria bacterium]|nr:hypothetical protein [Actinomycetota bacterium]